MIGFPEMLVNPAREAGIAVPDNPVDFDKEEFLHWDVFLTIQIGKPMRSPTEHWENARVIGKVPEDKIKKICFDELVDLGLQL